MEFETIEYRDLADYFESVGPILFAIHLPDTVSLQADLQVDSHLSFSGSIGQPFTQPSGTIRSQAIRFFRRRLPLSDHEPQSELIQDSPETRGDARRQQHWKRRATLVVARYRFGTGTIRTAIGVPNQSEAVAAATRENVSPIAAESGEGSKNDQPVISIEPGREARHLYEVRQS